MGFELALSVEGAHAVRALFVSAIVHFMLEELFNEYYDAKLYKKANPELRFIERIKKNLHDADCKHIHIIGVSGTAMGTFALMLRDCGFTVSGSDVSFWPPMGPLLKNSGVEISEGWNADHISESVDLVVVGNACGPQHIEVIAAIEKRKPLMSMPEIMGEYFVGDERGEGGSINIEAPIENQDKDQNKKDPKVSKESFVVAGTHGKTTTSGLLAFVLTELKKDPTYLIGGVMQTKEEGKEGTSHRVGKGNAVVFEGDEYDTSFFDARPKFLHYRPTYSIITSVELDHVDIYDSVEEYTKAFEHLIKITKKGLVVSHGYPLLNKLIEEAKNKSHENMLLGYSAKLEKEIIVYGLDNSPGVNFRAVLKETKSEGQYFELFVNGNSIGEYCTPMYGEYNTLNTVAVLGILHQAGINIADQEVKNAIANFPGMKRRQEVVKRIDVKNILIIDDFAHHPTAVLETLKGIRTRFEGRRIVALFEPRSNTSRRKVFEHTYPSALAQADIIGIKVPPYRAEVDAGKDLLDPEVVRKEVEEKGKKVFLAETAEELVNMVYKDIENGDVIVVMSNGSFDGIHDLVAQKLA